MKNFFKRFLLFLLIILPFMSLVVVKADSGWDSSYDSHSSSSHSSSGGYSSHSSSGGYSSHSSSSSSYSSSSDGEGSFGYLLFMVIFIVIIVVVVTALDKGKGKGNNNTVSSIYKDITEEELKKWLPNMTLDYVKQTAYDKFVKIQNAWMNFDNDKLRELCTDELYNTYVADLDVLKLKNGQNIMSDFTLEDCKVTGIKEENGNLTIMVYMRVSFKDYVINQKTKAVIRGTSSSKITNNYMMTFVRITDDTKKIDKCPNCGAKINDVASNKCEYCGSIIVKDSGVFVLSKKTNINR